MYILTLERCEEMLDGWIQAEKAVMASQSYSIDGQTVTKANLSEIRKSIAFYERKCRQLRRRKKGKGRARVLNVIPMD